jgi:hypothetical protein
MIEAARISSNAVTGNSRVLSEPHQFGLVDLHGPKLTSVRTWSSQSEPFSNVVWKTVIYTNVAIHVLAWEMRIELTAKEIHTLILAVEHAKSTVAKGLQAEQTGWTQDENYLKYSNLEAKLKGIKQAAWSRSRAAASQSAA